MVRQLRSPIPWSDQAYVPQILKDWGKMVTGPQVSLEMKNRHSGRERGGRKGRGQRLIQAVWKLLLVTKGPGSSHGDGIHGGQGPWRPLNPRRSRNSETSLLDGQFT